MSLTVPYNASTVKPAAFNLDIFTVWFKRLKSCSGLQFYCNFEEVNIFHFTADIELRIIAIMAT